MKQIIYIFAFLLFLADSFSLTEPSDETAGLKKQKSKTEFKSWQADYKTTSEATLKKSSKERFLAKEEALPKNHHKAKTSKKELNQEFEKHFEKFKTNLQFERKQKRVSSKTTQSF